MASNKTERHQTIARTPNKKNGGKERKKNNALKAKWLRLKEKAGQVKVLLGGDTLRFVVGFVMLLMALFMLLAFASHIATGWADQSGIEHDNLVRPQNYGGVAGAYTAYFFMDKCFGFCAFFIPLFFIAMSVKLMRAYRVRLWKWFIHCALGAAWGSLTLHLLQTTLFDGDGWGKVTFYWGGLHGREVYEIMSRYIGVVGACFAVVSAAILYMVYLSRATILVVRKLLKPQDFVKGRLARHRNTDAPTELDTEEAGDEGGATAADAADANATGQRGEESYTVSLALSTETGNANDTQLLLDTATEEADDLQEAASANEGAGKMTIETPAEVVPADGKTVEEVIAEEPYDPRKDLEHYHFPSLDLLAHYDDNAPTVDMNEQNANRDRIISVLRSFGVEIASIKATLGPTITLYEITPAEGVRISKIRNLEDDIALSLSALGIRIIAPIPGRGTIGIEVPNKKPRIVSMESILNSKKFQETSFELPIALGKTISNEVFMVDLAKMPHLLVAGATGMGKSVGLNAIITSLLYKKHPAELKFVMVDPKKVEFSMYTPLLHHFLAQIPGESDAIITDVMKVEQTLKSLCQLMDTRYDLLKMARAKNIKEYNAKFRARQLNPEKGHTFMPYIVVIIDEFGDLIMTAGKAIELPIARIAQLARAVGIHMVIATQRPTTNIITGTIKANFPARMAFRVSASVDSKTILDRPGAQQLIGRGDMLFLAGSDAVRVQCAFVDTPEVENINAYIAKQQGYLAPYELPEVTMEGESDSEGADVDLNHLDPMFDEAARLIVVHQQGSTSLIQRKFAIGYNRAGRIMDQLEKAGIVGPTRGAKPREVLCADEIALEQKLTGLK